MKAGKAAAPRSRGSLAADAWRLGAVLVLLTTILVPHPAAPAVPPDIAARIETVAANYGAAMQRAQDQARNPNLAHYAAVNAQMDRQIGEAEMAAAVIDGIIRSPAQAAELMAAAALAAPDLANGAAGRVVQAFPGFRDIVYAAAAQPQSVRPAPAAAPAAAAPGSLPPAPWATAPVLRPPQPARSPAPPSGGAMSDEDAAVAAMQLGEEGPPPIEDPLEGFNRAMFEINDVLDRFLLRPIAWAYGFIMPDPAKEAVQNVVRNIGAPVVLANDLLQLELDDAGNTFTRFVINSTAGLAGMFDVADGMGFKHREADFGQTLYSYGVGSGPYLVLPILGPSTPRHAVGQVADSFMDPIGYVLETEQRLGMTAGKIVVKREAVLDELDRLRADTLDYYAAIRSLYLQNRRAVLEKGAATQDRNVDRMFETAR